jgi:hypothetical protein
MRQKAMVVPIGLRLQRALVRVLIAVLTLILGIALYLALSPNALERVLRWINPPGMASIPSFEMNPPAPEIKVPRGEPPQGPLALTGVYESGLFACGFLLQLEDGQRVGVSSAHAAPYLPVKFDAAFLAKDGSLAAMLAGQIERGQPFRQESFTRDYALWEVAEISAGIAVLQPDPRWLAQPGERVWLYDPFKASTNGSDRREGVVMQAGLEGIWVQMDESFDPQGFSGCPLVSQHTGRVVGMAVAGEDRPPVVIGAHPIASIVQKALAALK